MAPESEGITPRRKLRVTTGCQTCRARRVKCDESKPSCNNCGKKHRTCVYDNGAPGMSRTRAAQRRAQNPSDIVSSPAPVHPRLEDDPSHSHAQSAVRNTPPRVNAEQNSQGVSPVNPEGVGPRHIRDEPAPDVASRGG
ncbi:uncharacterized protein N7469_004128 [Penicillium citrinum]|uniref:Zn(2)-C6 fungal-type domain-containing protein n=1 Tax=Penicillium citrinum TaxID=5077 RepID=A0A9W9P4G6_PENCI|nr:uncharacterized protein N7469_004128 [Penicillium citrinum]KAJ5234960.1 hypothetical protein N7469_004128 [Penicillium citrinum]